jgi:hypothetical protein
MTDMTAQQKADLKKILKAFPETVLDDEGGPVITGTFRDAEEDPVTYTIDADGLLTFRSGMEFIVSGSLLADLSRQCATAKHLFFEWEQTESGKAWNILIAA